MKRGEISLLLTGLSLPPITVALVTGVPSVVKVALVAIGVLLWLFAILIWIGPFAGGRGRKDPDVASTPSPPDTPSPELRGRSTLARGRDRSAKRLTEKMASQEREQRAKLVEEELVVIIDEGHAVRGDAFTGVSYAAYSVWCRKTAAFLAAIFGNTERQRFESDQGQHPKS